jgi:hypothetical protein
MNVRWKRYIAPLLKELKRRSGKPDSPQVVLTTKHAHNATRGGHFEPFAYRFACTQLYNSLFSPDDTLEEYLNAPTRRLRPREPRRNHFRIVENEKIPRTQKAGEVAHGAVARGGTIRPRENQQPTRRSLGERSLGNQFRRQVVGEVMALHARMVFQSPGRRDETAYPRSFR